MVQFVCTVVTSARQKTGCEVSMEKCDEKSELNGQGGQWTIRQGKERNCVLGKKSGGGRARGSSRRTTAIEERQ